MGRQNEITEKCIIPAPDGTIANPGWARCEMMQYTRENMKAPWFRKKEWDYYLFTNKEFGVAFTISDLGYVGLLSASFIDLKNKCEHTESDLAILPRGKAFGLGSTVEDAHGECHTKKLDMKFERTGERTRHISCSFRNFDKDKQLRAELDIFEPDMEEMFICTPWKEKATAFYYNCKKNCLSCSGKVVYGEDTYVLKKESSFGVLDWGRGIWTYDNTWFWGTGSGTVDGELFGFNLGYGFSDRSSCSENVIFYKNKIHKLDEIDFGIPDKSLGNARYLSNWHIKSNDGRFEAEFNPILDRSSKMNFGVIISDQHQVFGRMSGIAKLDDGTEIRFRDFVCALEEVRNKY